MKESDIALILFGLLGWSLFLWFNICALQAVYVLNDSRGRVPIDFNVFNEVWLDLISAISIISYFSYIGLKRWKE